MRSRLVNEIDEFQTMEGFLDGVTEDATGRFCENPVRKERPVERIYPSDRQKKGQVCFPITRGTRRTT